MPQKPFQIQGYFLDRFENVAHSLNLETKQSANTKEKLYYKEHAGQPGVEHKWSKYDMKKKSKKGTCGNSICTKFSKLTWEFNLIVTDYDMGQFFNVMYVTMWRVTRLSTR